MTTRQQQRLRARAHYRCEYCHTPEYFSGGILTIDHVLPKALGGSGLLVNLALCCFWCNVFKGAQTTALDADTQQTVALFNPRRQVWQEHFCWSDNGAQVLGLTPVGRATVTALQFNHPQRVEARHYWEQRGVHPRQNEV